MWKPMLTEDFLIRMINQAVAALARIAGLKASGQYQQALQETEQALEELVGMRVDLIKRLEDDSLIEVLTSQGTANPDRLALVADLFLAEGDIYAAQNQPEESYWSYLRALGFFIQAMLNGEPVNVPSPDEKIKNLLQALEGREIPPETLFPLFGFYEIRGLYTKADSVLDKMQQMPGLEGEIQAEKMAFYHRLLEKSNAELAKGGMRRKWVEDRLAIMGK